jgi:hypothetical protein
MKMIKRFIGICILSIFLLSCSGNDSDNLEEIQGIAYLHNPVVVSAIDVQDLSGNSLNHYDVINHSTGYFMERMDEMPYSFKVIITTTDPTDSSETAELQAVAEDYDPKTELIAVNAVTTMIAQYMDSDPGLTLSEAIDAVKSHLEISSDFDLKDLAGKPDAPFDHAVFISSAIASGNSFNDYITSVTDNVGSGNTQSFTSVNSLPALNFDEIAGFIGTNIAQGAMAEAGSDLFGLALQAVGINWFDDDKSNLSAISTQLTNIATDITNLENQVKNLGEKIESDFDKLEYMTLYSSLSTPIANIQTWNSDMSEYADEVYRGEEVDSTLTSTLRTSILSEDGYSLSLHNFQTGNNQSGISSGMQVLQDILSPSFYSKTLHGELLTHQYNQLKGLQLMELNLLVSAYTDGAPPDLSAANGKYKNYNDYVKEQYSRLPIAPPSNWVVIDKIHKNVWSRNVFGPYDKWENARFCTPKIPSTYLDRFELPNSRRDLEDAFSGHTREELNAAGFNIPEGTIVWSNEGAPRHSSTSHYYAWDFDKGEIVNLPCTHRGAYSILFLAYQGEGPLTDISISTLQYNLDQMTVGTTTSSETGTTTQLTVMGTYNKLHNIINQYFFWESSDESIATVSNVSGSEGLVTWLEANSSVTITGSRYFFGEKVSKSKTLTGPESIAPPTLTGVTIHPINKSYLELPIREKYYVTGVFSDGSTQNITSEATYTTSDSAAKISKQSGFEGYLIVNDPPASQPVTITATYEGVSVSTEFNVLVE